MIREFAIEPHFRPCCSLLRVSCRLASDPEFLVYLFSFVTVYPYILFLTYGTQDAAFCLLCPDPRYFPPGGILEIIVSRHSESFLFALVDS